MKPALLQSVLTVALPVILSAGCLRAAPQVPAPPAFAESKFSGDVPANLRGPGVTRVRSVGLNLKLFDEAKARPLLEKKQTRSVVMNFFPNVNLPVTWNQVERVNQPVGFMWQGTVDGTSAGRASLVISGMNVTATVTRSDGWIYEIRTTSDGKWWVREIDQSKFPQEGVPLAPAKR